ncbi:hypothetical protein MLD38_001628 [Melastoma candidum]|uniref:Uncharacterized protein n=1 Tax=Melastoma candidum TaxID=119954 RepID=A0ACB9SDV3_9MYRT|nr:hypothetical protein MLD38_001628 [Melastoma candidum]
MASHSGRDRGRVRVSWIGFFWFTLLFLLLLFISSSFPFLFFSSSSSSSSSDVYQQPLVAVKSRSPALEAVLDASATKVTVTRPAVSIRETVVFPDQTVIFLRCPPSSPWYTKEDLLCVYLSAKSPRNVQLSKPPFDVDGEDGGEQMVRCPLGIKGQRVSLALKSNRGSQLLPPTPVTHWDSLAYDALIDRDNTTIVFVKGFNLKPERTTDPMRFECIFGWDFRRPRFMFRSEVKSIAQEIVRCRTPLGVLNGSNGSSIKVSVRIKGGRTIQTIARPHNRASLSLPRQKLHEMCVCTMLRNQAKHMREWVIYHAHIGVQRWFIYDNNSDDDIADVIESLYDENYNISRHVWPWVKTQEAGFVHCALRARDTCQWVGFIDVDEFLHLPSGILLDSVLRNESRPSNVAELRVSCHSFGPSGLKHAPREGVTVGYTCRIAAPERHKSIVRPEALNSTLINVVHHFHLKSQFDFANVDRGVMVINHYKYQVWEVFKEKFYRRVATYVADWKDEQNVGSKDRAPGLGTKAVEPPDWSTRFCEVNDTGLRDRVLQAFADTNGSNLLPWQRGDGALAEVKSRSRRGRRQPLVR